MKIYWGFVQNNLCMSFFCSNFVPIIEIMNFVANIRSLFPAEAAKQAVENDVHVLGVSSLAAGHKTLIPQVIEELKKLGRPDIMVTAGGVIPAGVAAIFGPGTPVAYSAKVVMQLLMQE